MDNIRLVQQWQRIDALSTRQELSGLDPELLSHWAKYLCVLYSGFLENSIAELYGSFASHSAHRNVAHFVETRLRIITNPKAQRFFDTAHGFSSEWGDDLQNFMADNGRKEAIDSIIANRNLIAHGKNCSITLVRLKEYMDKATEVIEFIEGQCR